jgi:uncharacterized membrane protein YgcG
MSHKFLIPFLTAACLVAPAVLPRALVSAMVPGLSGAAQAKADMPVVGRPTLRTTTIHKPVTTPKASGGGDRMGGGGGARGGGARMGGGGGGRTKIKVGGQSQ